MNMLNRYYGNDAYREQAAHAMRLPMSASAEMVRPLPGVLLPTRSWRSSRRMSPSSAARTCEGARLARSPARCPLQAPGMAGSARRQTAQSDVEYPDFGSPQPRLQQPHLFPSFNADELAATVKQMAKLKPQRAALN
jgi:hypothetical protein